MSATPPPFQEAVRCDVCKCSFTAFRRRHHCRCCGRTLCHDHSSDQMALPQFGIYSNVRVCSDCFNNSSWSVKDDIQASEALSAATDGFSTLKVVEDNVSMPKSTSDLNVGVPECKCGMPLCICEAPKPDPAPVQLQNSTISSVQSNPRPKKVSTRQSESSSKKHAAASTSNPSSFFNVGEVNNGSQEKGHADYDVSGEGLRDAIKNGDALAAQKLLNEGVDANYRDKQGMTLLHLAAVFNQTEISFILMDNGASVESTNSQGETPLDCAPTMLQYKMRKKMEELSGAAEPNDHFVG